MNQANAIHRPDTTVPKDAREFMARGPYKGTTGLTLKDIALCLYAEGLTKNLWDPKQVEREIEKALNKVKTKLMT